MVLSMNIDYGTGNATIKCSRLVNCSDASTTVPYIIWPNIASKATNYSYQWEIESQPIEYGTCTGNYRTITTNNIKYAKITGEWLYTGDAADTTATIRTWCDWSEATSKPKTPQERLKEIIQRRQAPLIFVSRKPIQPAQDVREERARETLRLCLGEDRFRSFIKNGFVTAKAKSGLVYQIFPGHGITCVYKNGVLVERLCVVFRGDFPPADSLIMRFLLILNDEDEFRRHAIKHSPSLPTRTYEGVEIRSLPELYRELKGQRVRAVA